MLHMLLAGAGSIAIHYSIALVLAVGLGFAFWFGPPRVQLYSIAAGIVLAIGTIMYTVGVHNGEARVQAQWNLAEKNAAANAATARAAAERQILTEDRALSAPVVPGTSIPLPRILRRSPPVDSYDRP